MNAAHQCPECEGKGVDPKTRGSAWPFPCANCDGCGWLDEHGEPLELEPELPKDYAKETT